MARLMIRILSRDGLVEAVKTLLALFILSLITLATEIYAQLEQRDHLSGNSRAFAGGMMAGQLGGRNGWWWRKLSRHL